MKHHFLIVLSILCSAFLRGQVGISTGSPQGIFHIDTNGNTSGTTNLKDDIIIASDGLSGVNVALGGVPLQGVSLSLNSTRKGFLPNRVGLTSTLDVVTVPSPVEGMVVYNTVSSGVYPNNTLPGYYIYDGIKWKRLRTNAYLGVSDMRSLQTATTTLSSTAPGATPLNAPELDFGTMQIYEDGAYALSFTVSATSSTGVLPQQIAWGAIYIYILKKGVNDADFTDYRTIEFDPPLFPDGQSFTLSTLTGLDLRAQDQLKFTTRHYSTSHSITYTAATFLTYWKL